MGACIHGVEGRSTGLKISLGRGQKRLWQITGKKPGRPFSPPHPARTPLGHGVTERSGLDSLADAAGELLQQVDNLHDVITTNNDALARPIAAVTALFNVVLVDDTLGMSK